MAGVTGISIPRTSVAVTGKPHTIYHIALRFPLQSFTLEKRYSDFVTLSTTLTSQAGSPPPFPLPPKFYFARTVANATLTEARRAGLEQFLKTIYEHEDSKWRNTPAWRSFLDLPSGLPLKNKATMETERPTASGETESGLSSREWLDINRRLQAMLHEVRLMVAVRDKMDNGIARQEKTTEAKKGLAKANSLIALLQQALKIGHTGWGASSLSEGELRRRRDLLAGAILEKDGLERLLYASSKQKSIDWSLQEGESPGEGRAVSSAGTLANSKSARKGRTLGRETAETRQLDNEGVLLLQQRTLQEQDGDLDLLAATVRRQKDLAVQINEELEVQQNIFDLVDEDAARLEGKLKVAKDRVDRIS